MTQTMERMIRWMLVMTSLWTVMRLLWRSINDISAFRDRLGLECGGVEAGGGG